jgi:hypothetical protein
MNRAFVERKSDVKRRGARQDANRLRNPSPASQHLSARAVREGLQIRTIPFSGPRISPIKSNAVQRVSGKFKKISDGILAWLKCNLNLYSEVCKYAEILETNTDYYTHLEQLELIKSLLNSQDDDIVESKACNEECEFRKLLTQETDYVQTQIERQSISMQESVEDFDEMIPCPCQLDSNSSELHTMMIGFLDKLAINLNALNTTPNLNINTKYIMHQIWTCNELINGDCKSAIWQYKELCELCLTFWQDIMFKLDYKTQENNKRILAIRSLFDLQSQWYISNIPGLADLICKRNLNETVATYPTASNRVFNAPQHKSEIKPSKSIANTDTRPYHLISSDLRGNTLDNKQGWEIKKTNELFPIKELLNEDLGSSENVLAHEHLRSSNRVGGSVPDNSVESKRSSNLIEYNTEKCPTILIELIIIIGLLIALGILFVVLKPEKTPGK